MRTIAEISIRKLQGEGSYYAHVEYDNPESVRGEEEFHADDIRTLWDRITFHMLDREKEIEDYEA